MYSVDGSFQLVHRDIKSATHPKYCLVAVDVYSSKRYVYPMRQRDLLTQKLELFHKDSQSKRKNKKMRLHFDLEFQKNDIKELNKKYNVEMFSTKKRGGNDFATEQKIKENKKLKKRISKLRLTKSKSKNPHKLIKMSVDNMNKTNSSKYGLPRDEIENRSLLSEKILARI